MDLSKETLLEMYWRMLLSRRLDERAWELHKTREIGFHHSSIGHEAAQVAAANAIDRKRDWVAPYYRDLALVLTLGLSPRDFVLGLMGKADEPSSGGRQMPSMWSLRSLNILSISPVAAAQIPQAVGVALGIQRSGEERIVLASCGEGAASAGEWAEAVNWAAVQRLPVVFLIQNNRLALSTPQEAQMAVASPADKARGLGLPGVAVDGLDLQAVYRAVKEASDRARNGGGPALVEARTWRITPHSTDDDDRLYRSQAEVEKARMRDPVQLARTALESSGVLSPHTQAHMENRAFEIVEDAVTFARNAPDAQPGAGARPVYAEDVRIG
jgi:2-oxoisovalerate dehydrogenase E1 component alpha subunit